MVSCPCMPSMRVSCRGATSSASPSPMLNQPRPRARASAEPALPRPASYVASAIATSRLRIQHDLDAAVLLVAERLVQTRAVLELGAMGDHEGRVDLALLDPMQQVVRPAVHMGLAHAEREAL